MDLDPGTGYASQCLRIRSRIRHQVIDLSQVGHFGERDFAYFGAISYHNYAPGSLHHCIVSTGLRVVVGCYSSFCAYAVGS